MNNNNYPVLPHIAYGLLDEGGFYFTLPFHPVSLNDYRHMHFGAIKKLRGQYKSVLDVIVMACVKRSYISEFDENGVTLWEKSAFDKQVDIEWALTFRAALMRDPSNYTQKILLDAVTDIRLLQGDSKEHVKSDKTFFCNKQYDSITCILRGITRSQMFLKGIPKYKYKKLIESLEKEESIKWGYSDGR